MSKNFLQRTRSLINIKEPVCIVLGNESCDLDSAVCAVSLSYYYQCLNDAKCKCTSPKLLKATHFLPVLNIPRKDFALKTEVQHIFNSVLMQTSQTNLIECLTFTDDLSKEFLERCQFMLVDHHISPWIRKTVAIYDHRPRDELWEKSPPVDCEIHIEQVGSCSTLIAEKYFTNKNIGRMIENNASTQDINEPINHSQLHLEMFQLLRSAIILDTINFSKEASRVTEKDLKMCSFLEEHLYAADVPLPERKVLFDELVKARADIQHLSAAQLLRKDMKVLNENCVKVCMPGFPITVEQFIQKYSDDARCAIDELAQEMNCNAVILMGMYVNPSDKTVNRDIGVINVGADEDLCELIQQRLLNLNKPLLSLESTNTSEQRETFMSGHFYKQNNIQATRKHILPVVKQALEDYCKGKTSTSNEI